MHKGSLKALVWALAFVAFTARADKPAQQQLELAFDGKTLSVKGVTPGADVYIYSVSREGQGYYNSIVPRETVLHDTAKSGRVDYTLDHPIALRSIWFAVDLSSGAAVSGTPANYNTARALTLDGRHLKKNADGDVEKLSYEGALVDVVVVRPGTGIWGGTIGLHDKKDESGKDDKFVTISALNLEPRMGTTAAAMVKLKKGDVIFMMDSYAATYAMAVVGGTK